jgi:hypothetical protein
VAFYQKKLYEYSVNAAESHCTSELLLLITEIGMEVPERCELIHDDIWLTLFAGRVGSNNVRTMECHLNYRFWGPSLPENCQFIITPLTGSFVEWIEKNLSRYSP